MVQNKYKIKHDGKWRYFPKFKNAVKFAREHPLVVHPNEEDELPLVYEMIEGKWEGFAPNRYYMGDK